MIARGAEHTKRIIERYAPRIVWSLCAIQATLVFVLITR